MKRLNPHRIRQLSQHLRDAGAERPLFAELLDHLACEAEERLWEGGEFEDVLQSLKGEVNNSFIAQLNQTHFQLAPGAYTMLDMVFEGRNKAYGAYVLRRGYQNAMQRAFVMGVAIFVFLVFLPRLITQFSSKNVDENWKIVELVRVPDIPTTVKHITATPPELVAPIIKRFGLALPNSAMHKKSPPNGNSLKPIPQSKSVAQNRTLNGIGDALGIIAPSQNMLPRPIVDLSSKKLMPTKDASQVAVRRPLFNLHGRSVADFFRSNLNYPQRAKELGIHGQVKVGFTVLADGSISNVELLKGIGSGCDQEALRVVRLMPNWAPGSQHGKPVKVKYSMLITFALNNSK